jgi:hypothetical protein
MGMTAVYLDDTDIPYDQAGEYFAEISAWATRQCSSYVDYYVQDVTDVSLTNDFVTVYYFKDPTDALLFQLKWKTS